MVLSSILDSSTQLPSHLFSSHCLPQSPQPRPGTTSALHTYLWLPGLLTQLLTTAAGGDPFARSAGEQQGLASASPAQGDEDSRQEMKWVSGAAHDTEPGTEGNSEFLPSGSRFPQHLVEDTCVCMDLRLQVPSFSISTPKLVACSLSLFFIFLINNSNGEDNYFTI